MFRKGFILFLGIIIFANLFVQSSWSANPLLKIRYNPLKDRGYALPLVKEPFVVKFATQDNPNPAYSYSKNLPIWQELEKRTGIKVQWEVSATDYNTIMKTRLASGVDLPDVVKVPGDPMEYVAGGILIPLEDLIDKYAPNIKKLFADRPDIKSLLTAPDGHIYVLSSIVEARAMINIDSVPGVRKDWLKKFGMSDPDTIEDWYKMLKVFKEKDPNENGKNDEIPFIGGLKSALYPFIDSAYNLHVYRGGFYPNKLGKVEYSWILPRAKEALSTLAKWYKEGLIDPNFLSRTTDQWLTFATSGIAGATVTFSMYYPQFNQISKGATFWESVLPPRGPYGRHIDKQYSIDPGLYFGITRDCKRPDIVIRWLDYIYASEEGIILTNFGIEGHSYVMKRGIPTFTDWVLKHPQGSGMAMWSLGAPGYYPAILHPASVEQRFLIYPNEVAMSKKIVKFYTPSFPPILGTKEEVQELARLMSDINTYVEEMVTKFIMGQEPVENFDKFVKQLKNMGIDKVIQIKQVQYDRFTKAKK